MALPVSIFADISDRLFRHRYAVTLHVGTLVGGVPTDPNVAEGWIRTKLGKTTDELIRDEVEKVMDERGVKPDAAVEEVAKNRHLTGFKRNFYSPLAVADQRRAETTGFVFEGKRKIFTPEEARATFGELFIEGRQIKAMFKEATMITGAAGNIPMTGWGKTRKAIKGFLAEHMFVLEDEVPLGVTEPSEIVQSFVHTWRGAGIKLEEHVNDVEVKFTIVTDDDFTAVDKDFFGKVLVVGEMNGLGASRSQGYGRFVVTRFDKL